MKNVKEKPSCPPHTVMDMHSHILPGMDDGARSVEEAVAMLERMTEQGIHTVVSTSHFYPEDEAPDTFLARRRAAVLRLGEQYDPTRHPALYIGAEVAYYAGISRSSQMEKLCIAGTRDILVEMPMRRWSPDMLRELITMEMQIGIRPILAHMERCLFEQPKDTLRVLREHGVRLQSNGEYILHKKTNKQALRFLADGHISYLGSDAHGLEHRAPNLGAALAVIYDAQGQDAIVRLEKKTEQLLKDAVPMFDAV